MSKQQFFQQKSFLEMSGDEKEQLINKIGQAAYENEVTFHGCAQATLIALQQHLHLVDSASFKAIFKAINSLCAGLGRTGEGTCGPLVAGVMAIGLAYGREMQDNLRPAHESADYLESQRRTGILFDRFKAFYGGVQCRDLQKHLLRRAYNMRDPKDLAELHLIRDVHERCGEECRKGAELAARVILEPADALPEPEYIKNWQSPIT